MFAEEIKKNLENSSYEFGQELKKVASEIKQENEKMFRIYERIVDNQMNLINLNFILFNFKNTKLIESITSLCYKNLISIKSALLLIQNGYLGSARMIFRNVYECLLIAKMFALTKNYELYEKWCEGKQISIKRDIFKKIKNAQYINESAEFWDNLNKFIHGTPFSQDFMLELDKSSLADCNNYISILLEMNFHILNRFVCQYRNWYLEFYYGDSYKNLKRKTKEILQITHKLMDIRCKKVVNDFKSTWILF